jgi:hypothetical protein
MVDREVERGSGWSLTIDNGKLFAAMKQKPERLAKEMQTVFGIVAARLEGEVKKGFSGLSGPVTRKPRAAAIGSREGDLLQSIKGEPHGKTLDELRITLRAGGRKAFYAPVQEFGTVGAGGTLPDITPNPPRKALTIPLPRTMTGMGVKRSGYDIVPDGKTRKGRPKYRTKSHGPTFLSGNAVMITVAGKPVPIYALKKRVAIPPRLRMGVTIDNNRELIAKAIGMAVEKTLTDTGAG